MLRTLVPAAVAVLFCFSVPVAGKRQGAQHSGTHEEQEAGTPDVFRLCAAEIPSERRIVSSLKLNRARLSPACRKVFS